MSQYVVSYREENMKRVISILALAAMALPAAAAGPQTAEVYGKFKPVVGSWAQYGFESKKGDAVKSKGTYRFAVVGKDDDGFWIEEKMTPETPKPKHGDGITIIKILMAAKRACTRCT